MSCFKKIELGCSYKDVLVKGREKSRSFPKDILRLIISFSTSKGLWIILWGDEHSDEEDSCYICGLKRCLWLDNGEYTLMDSYRTSLDKYSNIWFKKSCSKKCAQIGDDEYEHREALEKKNKK